MIIKKYRLKSQNDNEVEFEVTKHRVTTSTVTTTETVDDNGNKISVREGAKTEVKSKTTEGISAVSLPSRLPAKVEILEKSDPSTGQTVFSESELEGEGRPSSFNLTEALNKMDPTPLPKRDEDEKILWAE